MSTHTSSPAAAPFSRFLPLAGSTCLLVLFLLAGAGCEGDPPSVEKPAPETKPVEAKRVEVGKNVFFEVQGKQRRVVIDAYVCLREGQLEQLLTRANKKEHEAILAADVDARDIHKALLAAGATPGTTVRFQPKYVPPSGQVIKVTLRYEQNGKRITHPAQQWVRNTKTGKALDADWVFTGSQLVPNPLDPKAPDLYLANDGDVICVSNFEGALLDLPINSPKDNSELAFDAFTERIPPRETKVEIILEPTGEKK